MKALMIIDMQRAYIEKGGYPADLFERVNAAIEEYDPRYVYYIMNYMKKNPKNALAAVKTYKFTDDARLCEGILTVSPNIFEKSKGDAFTNKELKKSLRHKEITELELCGIDGGSCVALTALGARKAGFEVVLRTSAIGTKMTDSAKAYEPKLRAAGVVFDSDVCEEKTQDTEQDI